MKEEKEEEDSIWVSGCGEVRIGVWGSGWRGAGGGQEKGFGVWGVGEMLEGRGTRVKGEGREEVRGRGRGAFRPEGLGFQDPGLGFLKPKPWGFGLSGIQVSGPDRLRQR